MRVADCEVPRFFSTPPRYGWRDSRYVSRASGYFQAKPEFSGEVVNDTNLFHCRVGDVRDGHGEFTRKEHGSQSLPHLAAHLIFNRATRRSFLPLAAMESRAHFADQTFHSCDCEVEIDRECGS